LRWSFDLNAIDLTMTWTTPADLRAQVQRLWDKGELLASLASGEALFPRRLVLKAPSSAEISERFDAVRAWIAELRALPLVRVVMREFKHRLLGSNAIPAEVWVDTIGDALALIGKNRDAARFTELLELTRRQLPAILPWLAKRPLKALELSSNSQFKIQRYSEGRESGQQDGAVSWCWVGRERGAGA
jgi:hypothetical protein